MTSCVDVSCRTICHRTAAQCFLQLFNQHLPAGACRSVQDPSIKVLLSAPWDRTSRWQMKPRKGRASAALTSHSFLRQAETETFPTPVSLFEGFLPHFGLHDRVLQSGQKGGWGKWNGITDSSVQRCKYMIFLLIPNSHKIGLSHVVLRLNLNS